jgi:hypothetical protein
LFPQLHTCDANPPWENKSWLFFCYKNFEW